MTGLHNLVQIRIDLLVGGFSRCEGKIQGRPMSGCSSGVSRETSKTLYMSECTQVGNTGLREKF